MLNTSTIWCEEGGIKGWEGWRASLIPWIWTWAREMMRDRETWHAAVLSVAECRTWLGDWTTSGVYAYNTLPLVVAYQKEACRATQLPESIAGLVTPAWKNARRNLDSNTISFRMDWLDILAVQGTLKSLLQYHSSKASILWCPACFIGELSHLYLTTWKTIPLTRQTFVGKVMSLLFNMLSSLVIAFLQGASIF